MVNGRKEKALMRRNLIPSLLIVVLGTLDCITTVIGVGYSGAKELNPFMMSIVNSNITAFMFIKFFATIFVASTYLVSRHLLLQMPVKTTKSYSYSLRILNFVYIGLIAFLTIVVVNNLIILLG